MLCKWLSKANIWWIGVNLVNQQQGFTICVPFYRWTWWKVWFGHENMKNHENSWFYLTFKIEAYENEPIPRNGGAIRLDDLGWLRPQEISQPTIHGTGMNTKITSTYHVMCIIFWLGIYPTHLIASSKNSGITLLIENSTSKIQLKICGPKVIFG